MLNTSKLRVKNELTNAFYTVSQVMEIKRFPKLHDHIVEVIIDLLQRRLDPCNDMVCSQL
jgi:hypothetical protein